MKINRKVTGFQYLRYRNNFKQISYTFYFILIMIILSQIITLQI